MKLASPVLLFQLDVKRLNEGLLWPRARRSPPTKFPTKECLISSNCRRGIKSKAGKNLLRTLLKKQRSVLVFKFWSPPQRRPGDV